MTDVPEKCYPVFDAIREGKGRDVGSDILIDCLARKISDNEGQTRRGKRSERKAIELATKLKTGEIKKFNPNLAFLGSGDPFDMTDEEFDKLQLDMLQLNWELLEPEEKELMKIENNQPDMSDDDFFEWIKKEELGIGEQDEPDGE